MHDDENFILDIDESRLNVRPELTGWEVVVFEIADEETEDRVPRTED
jgi:hypothetical protein